MPSAFRCANLYQRRMCGMEAVQVGLLAIETEYYIIVEIYNEVKMYALIRINTPC